MAKISIIGCGAVGSTTAYTLAESEWVQDIVLVDIAKNLSQGHALDIMHGVPLMHSINVMSGDYSDTRDSDIVVITVGVPEVVGESRLVPLQKNTDILSQIVPQIVSYSPNAILLLVTNPVDILTYVAQKVAGIAKSKVIGLGTMLDTSRLRYLLSRDFAVSAENIQTYVVGEHGDSQVILWSKTTINQLPVKDYAALIGRQLSDDYFTNLEQEVRKTAFDVWEMKGPNAFCVATAIKRVCKAILCDENVILPVSTPLENEDMYISLPSMITREGIAQSFQFSLLGEENEKFQRSLQLLKNLASQLVIAK